MDSQVGALLEECRAAAQRSPPTTDSHRLHYCSCRDSLCAELASLLQEAMEMKWPFVPEKWQYKQAVSVDDKTNLGDLISKNLPQLLAFLKASIMAQEAQSALAVVFLVDRFLYWIDESRRLLKIAKLLHRRHPDSPIAPQVVIRQARVYFNSGKLQQAEYILSSLINNSGTTGYWMYHSESDRVLVQAVCAQVRGMILQKLGLWLEAAELIWASLVGYYSLPQPDKKGIGTSLGLLANILVSMNDEDFCAFRNNPGIDFSLLCDGSHRLLSAAQAAKMAVVYSQYTSLYVLTNVTAQGTSLLSYSFSVECPDSQRKSFLLQAKEAFAIGLLTKAEGELVTSKQELHTFIKAAYSLTVTHKWLGSPPQDVVHATQACQIALGNFYKYCQAETQDKESVCAEIMQLVAQVKLLLRVEPFPNSDKGSFIPDSYRNIKDTMVNFTLEGFSVIMRKFQKYHTSLFEDTNRKCKAGNDEMDGVKLCITALGMITTEDDTETSKKDSKKAEELKQRDSDSSSIGIPQESDLPATLGSTDSLGSSWQNISWSSSGSPRLSSSAIGHGESPGSQACLTTESDDDQSDHILQSSSKNKKQSTCGSDSHVGSHKAPHSVKPASYSSNVSSNSKKSEVSQAEIETQVSEEDDDIRGAQQRAGPEDAVYSLSQLTLRTSPSSLGDSFSSHSSWEKLSVDLNSPTSAKPQPCSCTTPEASQQVMSLDSDSFSHLETVDDSESCGSAPDLTLNSQKTGTLSKAQPSERLNVNAHIKIEVDSEQQKSGNTLGANAVPDQYAPTEYSTNSSFEMLKKNQSQVKVPQMKNPLCYSCLDHNSVAGVVPERQFLLSREDYRVLLAGVCHGCLLKRLHSDGTHFKLRKHQTAHSALHLKFSKTTGLWTARETCVYIGKPTEMQGKQRTALWVQFLHQEERLSDYVGKDYLKPKGIQFHLKDVERQMTAQYYVTEFNKKLYDAEVMAQIFFIPSEALLILNGDEITGCITVEPYMVGEFVKLTNNTGKKVERLEATKYGLAFGHFTYLLSDSQEVVVDLQGWVTANGKGLTYLTDPQIHSTRTPKECGNFADRGLRYFLEEQHGPECNEICQLLKLPPLAAKAHGDPARVDQTLACVPAALAHCSFLLIQSHLEDVSATSMMFLMVFLFAVPTMISAQATFLSSVPSHPVNAACCCMPTIQLVLSSLTPAYTFIRTSWHLSLP
ncbi:alpha-protein kinase 1 [Pholidichthys leucotaenia]